MIRKLIIVIAIIGSAAFVAVASASVSELHRALSALVDPQSAQRGPKPPIGFITLNKHNCTYGIGATEDELHIVITGDEQKCYALIRVDGYPLPKNRHVSPLR